MVQTIRCLVALLALGVAGAAGAHTGGVETGIAASAIVLGAMVALEARPPLRVGSPR